MNALPDWIRNLPASPRALWIFIAVAALQLAVPAWLILDRELALHRGERLVLAVGPVDPVDLVRGRYVALHYLNDTMVLAPGHGLKEGESAWVTWTLSNGIHVPKAIHRDTPREARIKVAITSVEAMAVVEDRPATNLRSARAVRRVNRPTRSTRGDTVRFAIPLNRFYMEETKAPEMEKQVRRGATNDVPARAFVRVRGNTAVLETVIPSPNGTADMVEP